MFETPSTTSFEHDGKTYELKMTRAGARMAEAQGLSASLIGEKPFSMVGLLFFASLYSHYKLNPNKAVAMLDDLLDAGTLDMSPLIEELSEEYTKLLGLGGSA